MSSSANRGKKPTYRGSKKKGDNPLMGWGFGSTSDMYGSDAESDVHRKRGSKKKGGGSKAAAVDDASSLKSDASSDQTSATSGANSKSSRRSTKYREKKKRGSKQSSKDCGDESDGYDSDTRSSYREYCMGTNRMAKACMRVPKLLKGAASASDDTVMTSPPSPTSSEMEDLTNPTSLPPETVGVRYSLRSAIGDGAAKQAGSNSVMERRDLRPNGTHFDTSHWSAMGARTYMEDRYVIEELGKFKVEEFAVEMNLRPEPSGSSLPITWFGVFDGHGGEKASQFCSDWLSSYLRHQKSYPFDLGYAMKSAFHNIDEDFVGTGYHDGTTACTVALVGGQRLICANAGDSRAIVVKGDGSVVRISRDHKPGVPDETRRISELGGRVVYWGRWRVEGLLAVSRSIGDASLKPFITADPEVCEYDIAPNDLFLVIASDGIWDVLDNDLVAQTVIGNSCTVQGGKFKTVPDHLKWTARKLCQEAHTHGSTDNFTAIVVDLQSYRQRSSWS